MYYYYLIGPFIGIPPSPTNANTNVTAGVVQNYLLYWDMGQVFDTGTSNAVTALNSMTYLFGVTLPSSYSNTALTFVVEQYEEDFANIMNFTAASVQIGVRMRGRESRQKT